MQTGSCFYQSKCLCISAVPVSLIYENKQLCDGEASSIKILSYFNDIHEDSGGYLHPTISSISLPRRLAAAGFTGTNGIESHPLTHEIIANMLLMIFMTHNLP